MIANNIEINRNTVPKEHCLDNSIKLLKEGYLFIPNRIRKYNYPLFQTRLMGQSVICMSGKEAAEKFYDQNLFTREGAMPRRIKETLIGKKGIQTLDGAAHKHRKQLFLRIMEQSQIDQIIYLTKKQWQSNCRHWDRKKQIILFDEATRLFFQVACKWAGVPLKASEARQKSQDMSAMIDAFGAVGIRHLKGRCARNRSECWAYNIIQEVRSGKLLPPNKSALFEIAWHKDLYNELLEPKVAAIELLNILRPITAIATYVTFGALALHTYPKLKKRLREDKGFFDLFAQEIRRYYPFGPFLGARVRNDFTWKDCKFKKGTLVLLDIYGTNHAYDIWKNADRFQPDRFRNREIQPFDFIPQGGGNQQKGTRCPGEQIVVELLKVSLDYLVNSLEYQVPLQDLSYPLNRIPTLPRSRFIINKVQVKPRQ